MPEPQRVLRLMPWLVGATILGLLLAQGGLLGVVRVGRVQVVAIPPQDHVEPQLLDDGTPVWVRTTGEDLVVLDALTPGAGPVGSTVGWCGTGDRWVDPHLGLTFAPDGARYSGIVPGRLQGQGGPEGLVQRPATPAGTARAGDPAQVGDPTPGPAATVDPPLGGERGHGPPPECRLAQRRLDPVADPDGPDTAALTGLADHALWTSPLDRDREGWQVADGWLQLGPGAAARWCAGPPTARTASACADDADVDVALGLDPADVGPVVTVIGGPLLVRLDGGRIVAAAVLPSSTWAGSSLGGTRTVGLALLGRDRTGSRLLVRPTEADRCLSPAPLMAGAPEGTQAVYIDADTEVRLARTTTLEGLTGLGMDAPEAVEGIAVDVVLDTVTCRALAIREV